MSTDKTGRLSLRLTPKDLEKIETQARMRGMRRTDLLVKALDFFIENAPQPDESELKAWEDEHFNRCA